MPARPALGVKIGNYPGDRPSAGLNQADIVFEEPVEGAITRLLAVFQCQGASLVGDLRSAREPDVGILSQLSDPLFVHAGGIDPVIALLADSPLIDDNLYRGSNGSAIIQQPGRVAPYSTFVNTASLWAFNPSDTTPPAPIFHYSAGAAGGIGGRFGGERPHPVLLDLRRDLAVERLGRGYLRYYSGSPDILLDGLADRRDQRGDHDGADVERPLGGEQRGRPRGAGERHRLGAPAGHAQRCGHRRHLEPVQPHPAGHPHRGQRDAHHPAARQHLGGAGADGIPVTPAARPRLRRPAPGRDHQDADHQGSVKVHRAGARPLRSALR